MILESIKDWVAVDGIYKSQKLHFKVSNVLIVFQTGNLTKIHFQRIDGQY